MQALTVPVYRPLPVEILQGEIRNVCGAFDLEPMRGTGLVAGDVSLRRMEYFDAAVVALDARYVQRGVRSIRQDPGEHLFLLVQDEGHCSVTQGDQSLELAPGDMFLVDSVEPSSFVYEGRRSNQISVHMPRDEMLHRFGQSCMGGVAIDRHDPLWVAMRAVLTKMLTSPDVQVQLREAFLCLMGAYLQAGRTGSRGFETLLSRALALIDRHREDPGFGPRELATRLNVSERMLQRHFQALGESPGHRLLNRRLELAHARLSGRLPEQAKEGVAGIAYDSGFNDLSYFYREFRKRYGTTPGAVARH
ncbi:MULTISPECIES: helix-turn-helix domain-containing protein [Sinorhizobium]|uniref:AraC family transcriptional regulator protein n=1 Tax=Rhizobium fredii TaxID=380 RepID=A0A2L0H7A1_RHIFR|nr:MULTISPECIES: helix-turn-helix domain-containing protein [Sinorhizobium]AUX77368.1 AraC family transcriptional regulator protein [Sinorhizobium fredii]PDT54183.1 AraC family transcriptional regulator [Sinorhizobium sp. NG07B]POH31241.1 AraC family transcriptional regulator [Sinorhizobium americanum]